MKCQQCEDRIQQLLDDRIDPRRDALVRQHVDRCSTCRLMLGFYACLDQTGGYFQSKNSDREIDNSPRPALSKVIASRPGPAPVRTEPESPWNRQLVLSVAIVMLVLVGATIFAPMRTARTTPVAMGQTGSAFADLPTEIHETVVRQTNANNNNDRFSDWIPTRFPNMSDVQFNSWGDVDLVSLVPKKPADTVRGFPVALESVAPIYRYSSELPVVSQWANGISYTLNLLRAKFPIVSPVPPLSDGGFGSFFEVERSLNC